MFTKNLCFTKILKVDILLGRRKKNSNMKVKQNKATKQKYLMQSNRVCPSFLQLKKAF